MIMNKRLTVFNELTSGDDNYLKQEINYFLSTPCIYIEKFAST